ncbi:hypothetical protein HYFRA_00009137 [Hymenoscyphus fraxineus]|uniref:FAD-binding domain-containing protein n=1 Tax=Hymenoscyphus fraxineus TaxID=746836 RepID=A0A9N9PU03_9HELO|nr:hypothetical protein HYFRA_00009137 [Hymenoscyphus fraxineus]
MEVAIAGAGITGLAAAISLRRSGYKVNLYERSSLNHEVGAAINVPPNVSRLLVRWGLDPVKSRFVKSRGLFFVSPITLEEQSSTIFDNHEELYGGNIYFAHRVDLHEALKKLATMKDGPGIPATIHVKSPVVSYDLEEPSMSLADGTLITADLVIAADGIHSIGVNSILGRSNPPEPAQQSNCCYRFLISKADLEADTETRFFTQGLPSLGLTIYPDIPGQRRFITYPCREYVHRLLCAPPPFQRIYYVNLIPTIPGPFFAYEVCNCAIICNKELDKNKTEDWQASVPKEEILEALAGYHPGIIAVAKKATEQGRWPLLYRPPISKWHKGNMALAGDAAHPMLPNLGQGGAQGIEDGLVLGLVLHGCTAKSEISERLALYEKIRRNRAASIQVLSNFGLDETSTTGLEEYMEGEKIPSTMEDILQLTYGGDMVEETTKAMRELQPSWNLPNAYFGEVADPVMG